MVVSVLGRPDTPRSGIVRAAVRQSIQEPQSGEQQCAPDYDSNPLSPRLLPRGLDTVAHLVFLPAPAGTEGVSSHFLGSHLERESTQPGGTKTTEKVEAGGLASFLIVSPPLTVPDTDF